MYNKLVRDKIPQIIESNGKQCIAKILNDDEYDAAIKMKLQEELNEFLESTEQQKQIEELADLVEVVYAFVENKGVKIEEFERIRLRKNEERGGFINKTLLCSVAE